MRGVVAPTWLIFVLLLVATATAAAVTSRLHRLIAASVGNLNDLARFLPLSILLFPVLRGKFPDLAYDSLMYKATLPLQMADWHTGDTPVINGFMVGTNLQEILNALLVMLAKDYTPALISTISFVLILLISPLAFPIYATSSPMQRALTAFAGLSAFVTTEASIVQGTAYQEPLLLLFLVASLVRCPIWPLFLGAAIAVKISAIFIMPLIVLYHVIQHRTFWLSRRQLIVGLLAGGLVVMPQLSRNLAYSGRIFGLNETLSALTDPPGGHMIMQPGTTRYDSSPRGGIINNAVMSACNMALLELGCTVAYKGDPALAFHILPASRSPLFAVLFCLYLGVAGIFRKQGRLLALGATGVFAICYIAFLGSLAEARYFLVLSFGFTALLMLQLDPAARLISACGNGLAGRGVSTIFGCWLAGSSLIPGTFTNVGWICKRELLNPTESVDMRKRLSRNAVGTTVYGVGSRGKS